MTDKKHPSHKTRMSLDASSYDEICEACGATDTLGGWGRLAEPCPVVSTPANPAQGVSEQVNDVLMPPIRRLLADFAHDNRMASVWSLEVKIEEALTAAIGAGGQAVAIKGGPDEVEWLKFVDRGTRLYTHPAPSGQAVAEPYGYANLYRDEDGDLRLGGVDVYPTPEPEWAEFADDYVGPVALFPASVANPPAQPGWREPDKWRSRLNLWFFRDLSDEQRLKLFSLFELPVDEIGKVHSHQRKALARCLPASPLSGDA